ncbi:GNAT family N-acetyltransferase [Colwellia psychrerythraea]|uniref:GCN5-related N-acetyltransferase n=1 Tax=Colwellia psychrerythraea TaxID=28229 RepID=A0A099L4J0_COLPS|nr:GNAT family N-acetyltransferase [Colwellia psychrerythraea]KGJ97365.1 GCN5-related N-acetyltransferase [Colwellia psychrerythraea]
MVTVRQATVSDIDKVYDLILAIAKHHDQEQYVKTNKQELINSGFATNPSFGVLLAEVNGKTAGYCSYTWNYSIWLGSSYMNIDDVFVWEEFRGQQVGEELMFKAKEVCLANGASRIKWEVEQDNHGAIKFYQRLGANIDIKGLFRWDVAP